MKLLRRDYKTLRFKILKDSLLEVDFYFELGNDQEYVAITQDRRTSLLLPRYILQEIIKKMKGIKNETNN